ncbi:MAG: glutamine--fructose-6-phosphate transaminase (isomerizing) [Kiritimatiellia bacterium]|jgi:glucosamine--fructose-6-phosphate aminotransferase (isomerizing)|nr:glutamine--fructose-6-phosphate transaminase (isomerizing) [Kiritimatiellia bacterium]
MCGIVGYIGKRCAAEILLNGLRRLEYRGYDSAGVALIAETRLEVVKQTGKVSALERRVADEVPEAVRTGATAGIAHTRWATHGPPTEGNAHPHLGDGGRLALVHNGIIENYVSLRRQLEARGCVFVSQTDTEALAHLIAMFDAGDLMAAVSEALKHVEGTYGVAVLSSRHPDEILVARKGSPLVIGIGDGETLVASDVAAIVAHTRQVIYLQDGDVARITAEGVQIRTLEHVTVDRAVTDVAWDVAAAEKDGYEHFMLKEIFEQPEALRNTIRGRLDHALGTAILSGLNLTPRELAAIRRLVIVACGTSLHAGMVGKYLFEELADLPTDPEQAAEFRYRNPILGHDDLLIAVSQSGETADTLAAVREGVQKGALVAGLCNAVGSTIAREAGRGVYLHAGPEIGVASTKAFTAQVTVLLMLALKIGRGRRLSCEQGRALCEEIASLPEKIGAVLARQEEIAAIAAKYAQAGHAFFIGRGILYPTALEGALKLKEISYIHAEGYQAAELKHGPIALLDRTLPVIALLNDLPGKEKTLGNVQECRARHAPVIGIVTEGDAEAERDVQDVIRLPRTRAQTAPVVTAVALQLFAYHVARARGCEIDQPRNLAKSVTVE